MFNWKCQPHPTPHPISRSGVKCLSQTKHYGKSYLSLPYTLSQHSLSLSHYGEQLQPLVTPTTQSSRPSITSQRKWATDAAQILWPCTHFWDPVRKDIALLSRDVCLCPPPQLTNCGERLEWSLLLQLCEKPQVTSPVPSHHIVKCCCPAWQLKC